MVVNGYATRWIRKGFPWVHPNEVVSGARGEVGEPVRVLDGQGKLLGRGLRDRGFLAARIYRHDDGELDDAWLASVVDRAIAMRRRIVDDQTTAWRLLHGENDGIPGLRVDHWAGHLTIVMDSPAVAPLLARIVPVLVERLQPASIWSCYRPDPRDERDVSGFRPEPGCLAGACEADVEVHERGMAMGVRPWEGPDTGVYTDMREVRRWLEPYWAGRRVVNTFAYTGAFSVAAARGRHRRPRQAGARARQGQLPAQRTAGRR
jgi:23S rRNA (cytosine1962-C5)-methyltransferase